MGKEQGMEGKMKIGEISSSLYSSIFEVFIVIVAAITSLVWDCVKRSKLSRVLLRRTRKFGRSE